MTAHYNFCIRVGQEFVALRAVVSPIIEFFAQTIGEPREVMRLDYQSTSHALTTWKAATDLFERPLEESEQLSIYMSLDPSFRGERSGVHLSHSNGLWVFCISLISRDLAALESESALVEVGIALYERINSLSNNPLLVAGGEELELESDTRSLSEMVRKIAFDESLCDFAIYPVTVGAEYDSKRYSHERLPQFQIVKRRSVAS